MRPRTYNTRQKRYQVTKLQTVLVTFEIDARSLEEAKRAPIPAGAIRRLIGQTKGDAKRIAEPAYRISPVDAELAIGE